MKNKMKNGGSNSYIFRSPWVIISEVGITHKIVSLLSHPTIIPFVKISHIQLSVSIDLASILTFLRHGIIGSFLGSLKEKIITTEIMGGTYR